MNPGKIIIGNFKMNVLLSETESFLNNLKLSIKNIFNSSKKADVKIVVAPSFISIPLSVSILKETSIEISAQNVSCYDNGAYTGEISGGMLSDASVTHVIIGHSERRVKLFENNEIISKKVIKALENDITPIICVGENLNEKENNQSEKIVKSQIESIFNAISLKNEFKTKEIIVAYEPIWAIGTGKTSSPKYANEMCAFIRENVFKMYNISSSLKVVYGGSMNEKNASNLLKEKYIDGGLIGGASLSVQKFSEIIKCAVFINS